jgi:hypothetical protein
MNNEALEFIQKNGLKTRMDAHTHFGETANIQPTTEVFRTAVFDVLDKQDIQAKVDAIKATRDYHRVEAINEAIKKNGWKLGIYAYRQQVTHTLSRRPRPLKHPRWQWRVVGHFFKGKHAIWYYNDASLSKGYAIDAAKSYPVPAWFKQQTLASFTYSNPKDLVFA